MSWMGAAYKKDWPNKSLEDLRKELDFRNKLLEEILKDVRKESAIISELKVFILTGKFNHNMKPVALPTIPTGDSNEA